MFRNPNSNPPQGSWESFNGCFYNIKKLYTSNTQWYRVNIYIPKGKNQVTARNDQTKARPKYNRKNNKSCTSYLASETHDEIV